VIHDLIAAIRTAWREYRRLRFLRARRAAIQHDSSIPF
jgi:hypothetical protein